MGFVRVLHISADFAPHAEHNELGHACSLKCALQKI